MAAKTQTRIYCSSRVYDIIECIMTAQDRIHIIVMVSKLYIFDSKFKDNRTQESRYSGQRKLLNCTIFTKQNNNQMYCSMIRFVKAST